MTPLVTSTLDNFVLTRNNRHTNIPQPAPSSTHRNLFHTFVITPTAYRSEPVNCVACRAYTAPTTWNSLPADILTCDSESGFKRLLKTHLFNNSFNVAWSPDWLIPSASVALPMVIYKYVYDYDYDYDSGNTPLGLCPHLLSQQPH